MVSQCVPCPTKKLEQEWAVYNFGQPVDKAPWLLEFFKEQEVELRTAKHEIQKITHNRDQIVKQYSQCHKELKTEKEKLQKEASKLNNLLEKKDKKIQQKDKEISELIDKTAAMLEEASIHIGNRISEWWLEHVSAVHEGKIPHHVLPGHCHAQPEGGGVLQLQTPTGKAT